MNSQTTIEADPTVPIIRITREFAASAERVIRAHLDPNLFVRWNGPADIDNTIDYWEPRSGGSWRYVSRRGEQEFGFRGCFHTVGDDVIVQTWSFEGMAEHVSLQTARFYDLPGGRSRLVAEALADSFEVRDQMLASGMRSGVEQGYEALDDLLSEAAR